MRSLKVWIPVVVMAMGLGSYACKTTNTDGGTRSGVSADYAGGDQSVGVHGMILFGKDTQYLYHLPLYSPPHDHHVIIEVDMGAAKQKYVQDRASTGTAIYSVRPESFSLMQVVNGQKTSFRGTLFRGHFEQGGTPIQSNVTFTVKKLTTYKHLAESEAPPSAVTYRVFGNGSEMYAAHVPAGSPSFDQVIALGSSVDASLAGSDITVDRADAADTRLQPGQSVTAHAGGQDLSLSIGDETYFGTGDLGG